MFLKSVLLYLLTCTTFCSSTVTYKVGFLNEESFMMDMELRAPLINSRLDQNIQLKPWTENVKSSEAFSILNLTCHMLDNDVMTIFGPVTKSKVDIVQSICGDKDIPHVLTSFVGPIGGQSLIINLYPSMQLLTKAYTDILSDMNWKAFTLLYVSPDVDNDDLLRVTKIFQEAQNANFKVNMEILDTYDDFKESNIIAELKMRKQKFFVIDCHQDHVIPILRHFQSFGMVTEEYSYFFTNIVVDTEYLDLETFSRSGTDITVIKLFRSDIYDRQSPHNFKCLSEALSFDAVEMLSDIFNSLKPVGNGNISCKNTNSWHAGLHLMNYMTTSSFMGVTGNISFGNDRYRNNFNLYIDRVVDGEVRKIGTWNPQRGLKYYKQAESKPDNSSLNRELTVITLLREPYAMLKESVTPLYGNDRYEGYAIDLIEEISKLKNFSYKIIIGSHGVDNILQEVVEGIADLAVADITITRDRLNKVDFSHSYMHTGISILFKKPEPLPPSLFKFMRPLSKDIWVAIAIAFVAVTISLFIVGRLSPSEWKRTNPKSSDIVSQLTICDTVWFVTGSLFRQNTRLKIRIIAASWWLLCFLLIAMYIGALLAHTDVYENFALFTDVESLVENSEKYDIKYGTLMHGATMQFFMNSQDPIYRQIYQHMIENRDDMVTSIPEGVARAESSRYAFFIENSIIDYVTRRHCNLEKYGPNLSLRSYGIAVNKNSHHLRMVLSTAILHLSSMGKLDALTRKWWEDKRGGGTCHHVTDDDEIVVEPVSFFDISGVIHIMAIGVVLAVTIAIAGFLYHTYNISRKHKITFLHAFLSEIKQNFGKNVKKVGKSGLITRPVPEDEEHAPTSELVELS